MQPEGSSNISELASICDNLLSNKAQRNQELQSISDLLDGIKQLQAAQQASAAACDMHVPQLLALNAVHYRYTQQLWQSTVAGCTAHTYPCTLRKHLMSTAAPDFDCDTL
jgi:hypothetical protein